MEVHVTEGKRVTCARGDSGWKGSYREGRRVKERRETKETDGSPERKG